MTTDIFSIDIPSLSRSQTIEATITTSQKNPGIPRTSLLRETTFLPNKDFQDIIVLMAEVDLFKSSNLLMELMVLDPSFNFLRDIMDENEHTIKTEMTNAIDYFKEQFGIDVSSFNRSRTMWSSGNHNFIPYFIPSNINYKPYFTKENGNVTGIVNEGGFALLIGQPGITFYGKYGEKSGKFIPPSHIITFGYYNIKLNNNINRIIHYRSTTPLKTDINDIFPIDYEIYDFNSKKWGRAMGTSKTYLVDNYYHTSIRNILTFPGHLI